jgi:hypothetical protein
MDAVSCREGCLRESSLLNTFLYLVVLLKAYVISFCVLSTGVELKTTPAFSLRCGRILVSVGHDIERRDDKG